MRLDESFDFFHVMTIHWSADVLESVYYCCIFHFLGGFTVLIDSLIVVCINFILFLVLVNGI